MSRPQTLHLASAHAAGDPRIFQKECRTLAAAGFRVGLVVPHAHDDEVDGVRVHAVPPPTSGADRLARTTRAVVRRALAEAEGPDTVFHVHDAELLPLALGLALRGRRVVYDAHEDTPRQTQHMAWIPPPLRRPAGWTYAALEALGGRLFAGVVAAVPAIARRFPDAKTVLVRNFPVLDGQADPGPPLAEREAVLAYVGAITRARGAEEMVRAVGALPEALGARLELGGTPYPAGLGADLAALPGGRRTRFAGYLGRAEVDGLLRRARVGLVVLHPTPQYEEAYPTKLFEYMAAGVPAVASDFPLWRRMVEDAGCGLLVDPLDVDAIAAACRRLLTDDALAQRMGEAGRRAALDRYAWAPEGRRLVAFYRALAAGSRQPGAEARR